MLRIALPLLAALVVTPLLAAALPEASVLRGWVEEMKASERGPFARIRWFCKDGTVLPPTPYACKDRGGGSQHGEWTERVKQLRTEGFHIANVYADLDVEALAAREDAPAVLGQMLIEQFLIATDDGWILKRARYYRGALQEEGERRGSRRLLYKLAEDPRWLGERYLALRTAARLLDHGPESDSVVSMRQLASDLSKRDPEFMRVRNKIHVKPGASDAALVREYAAGVDDPALAADYERLARTIERVYAPAAAVPLLRALAAEAADLPELAALAREGAGALERAAGPGARFRASGELLARLRDAVPVPNGPALRIRVIDTSLAVEDTHFTAATELRARATRRERLDWLAASADAVYGAGFVSGRQLAALRARFATLGSSEVTLETYKRSLDYLALVPGWSAQWARFHFGDGVRKLAVIEPLAELFIPDLLRASPAFVYAELLDALVRDANRLAGVRTELFGEDAGGGLRALNPGLARGALELGEPGAERAYRSDGIYLLPETVADLPPVAGILTAGEGNPLSHVQLLARNLGIPNVAVDDRLIPALRAMAGRRVVLAASPAGSVELALDGPRWDALFAEEGGTKGDTLIRPDLDKLDLGTTALVPLSRLRASHSGRIVGPKAAKLGELHHHYPDAVADGLAIPFGVFRRLLEQPFEDTGPTAFEWIVGEYRRLEALPAGSAERAAETERFRGRLHRWILSADPGAEFRARLREAMETVFGPDGSYGVFVRSDTNVEDLPGFTGAGLNLTVPNVVGFENVVEAISRVWASPFSARAFAWRQAHMETPEHVYPAVLLMRSVPADKSGVLVTQDLDSGDPGVLSVAINEGVGGAVDGQAAESLRIRLDSGEVELLAQATATVRRRVNPRGGVDKVPVSGRDRVLEPAEIEALVRFARELPERFPALTGAEGRPAPADVEFGFVDGRLVLFQIRPFVESARARGSRYLQSLDAGLRALDTVAVALDEVPQGGSL